MEFRAWPQTEARAKVALNFVSKLPWCKHPIPSLAVPRAEPGHCHPDSQSHSISSTGQGLRTSKGIRHLTSLNSHLPVLGAASLRQGHCFWWLRTQEEGDPGGCNWLLVGWLYPHWLVCCLCVFVLCFFSLTFVAYRTVSIQFQFLCICKRSTVVLSVTNQSFLFGHMITIDNGRDLSAGWENTEVHGEWGCWAVVAILPVQGEPVYNGRQKRGHWMF